MGKFNDNMGTMIQERMSIMSQIKSLQSDMCRVESAIKRQMIEDGDVESLSVNWNKVIRAYI